MATVTKFTASVRTSKVGNEWESWIVKAELPDVVKEALDAKFPGGGTAWNIRMDCWITPDATKVVDTRDHVLALNNATMPCIVNGNVDYSAWDD